MRMRKEHVCWRLLQLPSLLFTLGVLWLGLAANLAWEALRWLRSRSS